MKGLNYEAMIYLEDNAQCLMLNASLQRKGKFVLSPVLRTHELVHF